MGVQMRRDGDIGQVRQGSVLSCTRPCRPGVHGTRSGSIEGPGAEVRGSRHYTARR